MSSSTTGGLHAVLHRSDPSWFELFLKFPLKTLVNSIYALRNPRVWSYGAKVKIVCISDTHNTQPEVPPGDILIHAGDLSQSGSIEEIQAQLDWLKAQPHEHKVFIAGNHDLAFAS